MRISRNGFYAEVRSISASQQSPGFQYLLYQLIDGQETLLYESHRFHHMRNCVAKADEHLERLRSWEGLTTPMVSCAA